MNSLVDFWRKMPLGTSPYIHPEDRRSMSAKRLVGKFDSESFTFDSFIAGKRFGNPKDNRFHTSLLPQPYIGRLNTAKIVILMLNPGFNYIDYYAEDRIPELRKTLEKNIRQELDDVEFPFLWLDPKFCWHSGFVYWEEKLRRLLQEITQKKFNGRYIDALRELSQQLAVIQLVPYHSLDGHNLKPPLPSTSTAREYVKSILQPEALDGRKTLIVARQGSFWALKEQEFVIVYKGSEPRRAHLSPNTRGGKAILRRFFQAGPIRSDCS